MDIAMVAVYTLMLFALIVEAVRIHDMQKELDFTKSQIDYLRDDLIHTHFEMEYLQSKNKDILRDMWEEITKTDDDRK
jgi:hypothetical protein